MALEGSLQDMSLIDLFQVFRMGPKTGTLLLFSGTERGVVYVVDGCLVDAVYVRGSERQVVATGEEAVMQLLRWENASFTFQHDPAIRGRQLRIFHDSDWLILEGMRRHGHPLPGLPQQITLGTQLALTSLPGGIESGVNLSLEQWRILSQIAICYDLGEICQRAGIPPDGAIQTVTELVAIGLIEVVHTPTASPRRQTTTTNTQDALRRVLTSVGAEPHSAGAPAPGRNLLHAVMRRIRSL